MHAGVTVHMHLPDAGVWLDRPVRIQGISDPPHQIFGHDRGPTSHHRYTQVNSADRARLHTTPEHIFARPGKCGLSAYRLDFEGEREEWGNANVVTRKGSDGEMIVQREERPSPPPELEAVALATIEELESGTVG